jgi:cell volume regulation protein A
VLITAVIVGLSAWFFIGFSLLEGLLLGAIVSSTDAAAVFSILRSKSLGLKGRLRPLLELESGSNDPMAYFLTILFIFLIQNPGAEIWELIQLFFRQMILGIAIGYFMGIWMKKIINWIKLEYDGLYSVLLLTLVFFTFSFTEYAGGNALLAIYIAGVYLGNCDFIHKKSLIKHFDGQAWLMQIVMFITLGLLVFPSQIVPYIGTGIVISVVLILLARPISIFLCLMFFKFNIRKKALISWVGLRGAVPIILATYPLTAGIEKSSEIFNIVFFVAITSVLIQGTTLGFISRLLKLSVPGSIKKQTALDIDWKWKSKNIYTKVKITNTCTCVEKPIFQLSLPNSIIIALIERNKSYFISDGSTVLKAGDILYIMADDNNALAMLSECLGEIENLG